MNSAIREYAVGLTGILILSVLAWFAVTHIVEGASLFASDDAQSPAQVTTGSYQLRVDTKPAAPRVGDNRITVRVRDSQGMNVPAARVRVVAETPTADNAEARLIEFAVTEQSSGVYRAEVNLDSEGEWPLLIEVSHADGGHADTRFKLVTGVEGLALVSTSPQGVTTHTCPMHPSVSQAEPGQCPLCGMALTPVVQAPAGVAHYTCPMHPSIKNAQPGQCPICGMDLAAVTHAEKAAGSVIVDQRRRQLIGLKTEQVRRSDLRDTLRLIGKVEYDPASLTDIALPHDGKVGELFVVYEGTKIKAGDPLFSVSSPDLYHAETDLVRLLEREKPADETSIEVARTRLLALGLTEQDVDELIATRQPRAFRTIHSPVEGTLVTNRILAGSVFWLGDSLMQIAEQSSIRVKATAYESDVRHIKRDMTATVAVPYVSDDRFSGIVDYISPRLDSRDRTADVYVTAEWHGHSILANSYADVYLDITLKEQILVPEQAVIHSGESRVVFVDEGEGRLQPRQIKTGRRNRDYIQVLDGLDVDERVVTSGNFLLASESKLKSGIDRW